MKKLVLILVLVPYFVLLWAQDDAGGRRRPHITPNTSAATTTQAVNETKNDTARINSAIRARSSHYHRADGVVVYVDTITGEEWTDSTTLSSIPRMKYPLMMGIDLGVNIWDPVMRLFGQKFGVAAINADVNLHNRYFPGMEVGLGTAARSPEGMNYTYRSPLSVYFKIGALYNFIYNSNPDYKFFAGLYYGFSPFSWRVEDVNVSPGYWGESPSFTMPSIHSTAGWIEFNLGLRVKLAANFSAGWMVQIHSLVNQSKSPHGEPWYIPGYGARAQMISGSFSFIYTIPFGNKKTVDSVKIENE